MEKIILYILGNNFSASPTLGRAHHIGEKLDRPLALIAKIPNFRDKEKVLRHASSKGEMTYENKRLSFFPDYSTEQQCRRDEFLGVKRMLQEEGMEYTLIYLGQLRIKHRQSAKFFSISAEAQSFLKELPSK